MARLLSLVLFSFLYYSPSGLAELPGEIPEWIPNDVHEYAESAMCDNGGGESAGFPKGVGLDHPGMKEVPMTWGGKKITWDIGKKIWLFDGLPSKAGKCSLAVATMKQCLDNRGIWTPGYPEASNTVEGAKDPYGTDIKCDYAPFSNNYKCQPYQKMFRLQVGDTEWSGIVRRFCAPMVDGPLPKRGADPNWNWCHAKVFPNIDFGARNVKTDGVTWLDTLHSGGSGPDYLKDKKENLIPDGTGNFRMNSSRYNIGFVNDTNDLFPGNDGTFPRPGGLRPHTSHEGARASLWWDTTAKLRKQPCTDCHSAALNGTQWARQSGLSFGGKRAYWHHGNDVLNFTDPTFFDSAKAEIGGKVLEETSCKGCHKSWMAGSSATPGGAIANSETWGNFVGEWWVSDWRKNAEQSDWRLKNAQRILSMPKDHALMLIGGGSCSDRRFTGLVACESNGGTWNFEPGAGNREEDTWVYHHQQSYELLACCNSASGAKAAVCSKVVCENRRNVKRPTFLIPEDKERMEAAGQWPPDPTTHQLIKAPNPPTDVELKLIPCAAGAAGVGDPADRCYQLSWKDPEGSRFDAPREYYWNAPSIANGGLRSMRAPRWTAIEKKALEWCPGSPGSAIPRTTEQQVPGFVVGETGWRFQYTSVGLLPKCTVMVARLCGGWCGGPTRAGRPGKEKGIEMILENPLGCEPKPECTLTASPVQIALGGKVTLTWAIRGSFTTATVAGREVTAATGSLDITPASTGPYAPQMSVTGPGGTGTCQSNFTVTEPKPTCTLTASPPQVGQGEKVTLTWNIQGSYTTATLDGDAVTTATGSRELTPAVLGTHVPKLTVTGPGGTSTCQTNYTVTKPRPTCTLSANPTSVNTGNPVTLSWNIQGDFTSALLDGQEVTGATGSTTVTKQATGLFTSTLTVNNDGATNRCQASFNVRLDPNTPCGCEHRGYSGTHRVCVIFQGPNPVAEIIDGADRGCKHVCAGEQGKYNPPCKTFLPYVIKDPRSINP